MQRTEEIEASHSALVAVPGSGPEILGHFQTSRCHGQEQLKDFVELLESPADFSGFGLGLESRSLLKEGASTPAAFRSSATYGYSC